MKAFSKQTLQLVGVLILNLLDVIQSQAWMSEECKKRCDSHRQPGWQWKYTFDCRLASTSSSEEDDCRNDCNKCPSSVCNSVFWYSLENPNIFKCPTVQLNDECKEFCNSNREKGSLDGYKFICNDPGQCREMCEKCPNWVCDEKNDENAFYCPAEKFVHRLCRQTCETVRTEFQVGSFSFKCSDAFSSGTDVNTCHENCKKCPKMICDASTNNDEFNCPALGEPKSLPTTTRRPQEKQFEGPCKDRCDKVQLDRLGKFAFTCKSTYSTEAEIRHCLNDCSFCPFDKCNANEGTFFCPGIVEDENDEPCKTERNMRVKQREDYDNNIVAPAWIAGISTIGFIVMAIAYCLKGRRKAVVPPLQVTTTSTTSQQPMPQQGPYTPMMAAPSSPTPGFNTAADPPPSGGGGLIPNN